MALDINVVTVVGRLTRDPELSYTPQNQTPVCRFSVANNRGGQNNEVNFFDITAWNKTATTCSQYLKKGRQVVVQGRLQQDRFEDKNGQKRSKVKIIANFVQFTGSKGDNTNPAPAQPAAANQDQKDIPIPEPQNWENNGIGEGDVPF
ncbi:MAG TPA: single-stranded DNA-binding protein [Spirochaetota bacterium]|nr:single-stranded DNA-binding protein [Spirochaetota bacterium]